MDLPRRTLDEIKARYELEPTLRDIFTEGLFDKEVYEISLKGSKEAHIVYDISTVEIPLALLEAAGLTDGNRQRVIYLSRIFDQVENLNVRFVIDSDFDHWLDDYEKRRYIVRTSVCSVECFFIESEIVAKVGEATRMKIGDFAAFYKSLLETLTQIYIVKLAATEEKAAVGWLSFDKQLSTDASTITVNLEEFARRSLLSSGNAIEIETLMAKYRARRKDVKGDFRKRIRGHDFTAALAWCVRKFKGMHGLGSAEMVERFLLMSADRSSDLGSFARNQLGYRD